MSIQKLSRAQIAQVRIFQDTWQQFLSHLGATFYGATADRLAYRGQQVVQAIIDKVYDTVLRECRGTLSLPRLVALFGYICGNQFALSITEGKFPEDPEAIETSIEANAQMFGAAVRVAVEELLARRGAEAKPTLFGADGKVLA